MSSREIALRGLTGDPMLQDSFLVESDGSPGDVGTKLVSKSKDSRLHEVELLAKDFGGAANGGDHPWTIENGTTSTLLLFNESGKPQWFNVQIAAGALIWTKAYQLQPNQTLAIDINELSRTSAKDNNGKAFPKDIWSGQVGWSVPQKNAGRGRLLQSNPGTAMARSFSCGWTIFAICGAEFGFTPSSIPAGFTSFFGGVDSIQTCGNSCSGPPAGTGDPAAYNYQWFSGDTNVAIIVSADYPWEANVYGVSAGNTTIVAGVTDGYCAVGAQAPVAVTPIASVTLNTGTVSSTDVDAQYYSALVGTTELGILSGQLTANTNACAAGSELVGDVTPSNWTGNVVVKRTLVSEGCYDESTSVSCGTDGVGDDTGTLYTENPQSGGANGNVYNLDAAGIYFGLNETTDTTRVRYNFQAYAVGADGQTAISPTISYFVRLSCKPNSSGTATLSYDASGSDNQIGLGTTPISWNLQ